MRIGSAWSALNMLTPIWKSNLDVSIKREIFRANVESVLTHSSQARTLTKSLENKLNGAYTPMLRAALKVYWPQSVINKKLYNDLPKLAETIRYRRLAFSGHIWRHDEAIAHNLILDANKWKKQKRKATENIYWPVH